ncbi:hypothetical protein EBB07_28845 [Paenibacillaceae bacterium]|nr:hypothetical protein EBB07_28845 [Paenibacillaceae bacterium]
MAKTLRESVNVVEIEGIVSSINMEVQEFKKDGKTQRSVRGEVNILVNEDTHSVSVFANEFTSKGKENGLFKSLQTIMNEYKSIETHGEDADKVRITTGKVGLNEYVGQDGLLKSFPQISSNFINRLKPSDIFEPKATFRLEMSVISVVAEQDKDEEETGRTILKGIVTAYEGRVFPFELIVEDAEVGEYMQDNYEKNSTVTVWGDLVSKTIVTEEIIKAAIGADQKKTTRRDIREYIVTAGMEAIDDKENGKYLDPKLIKQGLADRKERHEEMIEKKKNSSNSGGSKGKKDSGNPFKKGDSGKPTDVSEDELPF